MPQLMSAPLCIAQQLQASQCVAMTSKQPGCKPSPFCAAGTRSVAMMFRAVVFTFLPTIVELGLVTTVLARKFSASIAAAVLATFVLYVAWTTWMTKVGKHRLALLSGRPSAFRESCCQHLQPDAMVLALSAGRSGTGAALLAAMGPACCKRTSSDVELCHRGASGVTSSTLMSCVSVLLQRAGLSVDCVQQQFRKELLLSQGN